MGRFAGAAAQSCVALTTLLAAAALASYRHAPARFPSAAKPAAAKPGYDPGTMPVGSALCHRDTRQAEVLAKAIDFAPLEMDVPVAEAAIVDADAKGVPAALVGQFRRQRSTKFFRFQNLAMVTHRLPEFCVFCTQI